MKKVLQLLTLTTLLATSLSAASIHDAARDGDLALVKKLIKKDPTCVNARTNVNLTPLHYAAVNDNTEIVELLLSYGANVNVQDGNNNTPLHYAATGRTDTVEILLGDGADANTRNSDNETPLDIARRLNDTTIINFFATIPLLKSLRELSVSELVTVR